MVAALERVDLGHLLPSLDRTERWDRQLPLDEQQRLAFARLLLQAPRWVVLDDAVSALSDLQIRRVLSLSDREMVGATLIRLGRDPSWTASGAERCTSSSVRAALLRSDPPSGAGPVHALPTGSSQSSAAVSRVEGSVAKDGHSAT